MADIRPFSVAVPESTLTDLRERLARARFPDEPPGAGWSYGADLAYVKALTQYWRDTYDWRRWEKALNGFRHFTAPVAGIEVHYIHEEGRGPSPMPLLLSHGWPGSVWEFYKILPMLTDPARFGGDPADAFTVVAPSLPGYGFSFAPGQPRFGVPEIADVFATLMSDVLGYRRWGAQGGDWGGFITAVLGFRHAKSLTGIHMNLLPLRRDVARPDAPTEEEKKYLDELGYFLREETGYQMIQGTKPQTLAYGLTDSPVGLAAWIVEKFRTWSDCGGDVERRFTKDELLTNITIYWVTGAIGSSFWPYYARLHGKWPLPDGARTEVPTGYAAFPCEIVKPPRPWAEKVFNIQRWSVMPSGGHFAAMEEPEALAREIREFFRPLRGAGVRSAGAGVRSAGAGVRSAGAGVRSAEKARRASMPSRWGRRRFLINGLLVGLVAALCAGALLLDAGWVVDLVLPPAALLVAFAAAIGHRVVFDEAEPRVLQDEPATHVPVAARLQGPRDTTEGTRFADTLPAGGGGRRQIAR